MTIWILAILLLAGLAAAGYSQGAIKVAFSLVGIFAGMLFAMPLSPVVVPLLPFIGITNSWTQAIIAPIVAFYAIGAAFKIGAAFVHRKVEYHYKYHASDSVRALWERMNRRLGASLGLINGWLYLLLICVAISTLGYFTTQTGASESGSVVMRTFNRMALDLRETHMNKVVAGVNPAPERFYEISDFLGFVANNRGVVKRFGSYPPMVVLTRKPVFQAIANDKEYQKLVENERDPSVILDHPHSQEVLTNAEAMSDLLAIDLKDFTAYLSTGKSPKYQEERILGSWVYDFPASFKLAKTQEPDMLTSRTMRLKKELAERYAGAVLVATIDNKLTVQLPANIEGTPCPSLSNAPPRTSFTGTWKRSGERYHLTLSSSVKSYRPAGFEAVNVNADAVIQKQKVEREDGSAVDVERVSFKMKDHPVVFNKIPE